MQKVTVRVREADITIKRHRKGAQPYSMGACTLSDVTFSDDSIAGELEDEFTEQREPAEAIEPYLTKITRIGERFFIARKAGKTSNGNTKFKMEALMGHHFPAVYVCGTTIYVAEAKR